MAFNLSMVKANKPWQLLHAPSSWMSYSGHRSSSAKVRQPELLEYVLNLLASYFYVGFSGVAEPAGSG